MTTAHQNLRVHRGNSAKLVIDVTNADGSPFQPALEADFKYWISTSPHALQGEALVAKTLGNGITVVPEGVEVVLSATDTDLVPGLYYHELKVWNLDDVATTMTGYVVVKHALVGGNVDLVPASLLVASPVLGAPSS